MTKILKVKEKKLSEQLFEKLIKSIFPEERIIELEKNLNEWNNFLSAFNQLLDSSEKLGISEEVGSVILMGIVARANKK